MQKRFIDNGYLVFLCLLIFTDLGFMLLHLIHTYTALLPAGTYSIEQDRGYGEVFQYIKQFWIVGFLLVLMIRHVSLTNISWLLIFSYILLDDALSIHENFGLLASQALLFSDDLGLRPRDWGELFVTAMVGIVLLTPAMIAFARAGRSEKTHALAMAGLLGLLAFFGVFIDMVHILLGGDIWGMVEDGGEMLVVSLTFYYVFRYSFTSAEATPVAEKAKASRAPMPAETLGSFQPAMATAAHSV